MRQGMLLLLSLPQRLMLWIMPQQNQKSRRRCSSTNRLPPGAVNLERSYQICQAVIQNSPNRENLKAQLRPPAAILNQATSQQKPQQQQATCDNETELKFDLVSNEKHLIPNSN